MYVHNGFTHSLHTFLALDAHDAIEMKVEVNDLQDIDQNKIENG